MLLWWGFMLACGRGAEEVAEETAVEPFYSTPADCGTGVAPDTTDRLIRWPYVQWITEGAATVAWGSPTDAASATLEITRGTATFRQDADAQAIPYADGEVAPLMKLFSARIEGLEAGTEYCYRVLVDGQEVAGGLRFWTAPRSPEAPIKALVIGDFGAGTDEQRALASVIARHAEGVNLWITTGDNAYGDGTYGELHEKVFTVYQELLTRIPVYPTLGNHDYHTDRAQPYLDNFFLPENAWKDDHRERYYTLDFGPMTLFAFDSEEPLEQVYGSDTESEPLWGAAVLAEPSRPWRVAAFHKPVYSGHPERGPDPFVAVHLMPLFDEYGLDLGLTGHNHFYERFAPLRAGAPDPTGTTWIVTGGGGQGLYDVGPADHQEVVRQDHHFLLLELDGCVLSGQAISLQDEVIDAFSLSHCGQ